MMSCTGIHHPSRSSGSIEGNRKIFIDLLYRCGIDMHIDQLSTIPTASLLLFLLLCRVFLFLAALVTFVPDLLAVIACDFALICLVALVFNRSDLV
jgi:hypothetical protein